MLHDIGHLPVPRSPLLRQVIALCELELPCETGKRRRPAARLPFGNEPPQSLLDSIVFTRKASQMLGGLDEFLVGCDADAHDEFNPSPVRRRGPPRPRKSRFRAPQDTPGRF